MSAETEGSIDDQISAIEKEADGYRCLLRSMPQLSLSLEIAASVLAGLELHLFQLKRQRRLRGRDDRDPKPEGGAETCPRFETSFVSAKWLHWNEPAEISAI